MAELWDFFENMDAYVYAADADTHELVYLNAKMRDACGVAGSEYKGRKCYELLQNAGVPCAMCKNSLLEKWNFIEDEIYHPLLAKYLSVKDTIVEENGRSLRVWLAFDTGRRAGAQNSVEDYRRLEAISSEAIRVALKEPDPNDGINIFLEYLGKAMNSARVYIFERNAEGNNDNTYEWVAAGVTAEKENLQNVPASVCAEWYRRFHEGEGIFIPDVEATRESDPEAYEVLKPQNIQSLVVLPLYDENRVIGFYGMDNPPPEMMSYANDLLQIAAQFIVSTLRRRNLIARLKDMSYHDQLTHFGNRYAMNAAAAALDPEQSIGVVYCDITGLKRVNDTKGHKAGDELILAACASLKRVFGDYPLFRIGGDELLVFCVGISEHALRARAERLQDDLCKNNVTMAAGVVWHEKTGTDIDALLNESEQLMYDDKAAYYCRVGLDRRK